MAPQLVYHERTMGPTDTHAFERAIAAHQRGALDEAETTYRHLLAAYPNDANVQHVFGVLRLQTGHAGEAVTLFEAAIRSVGKDPQVMSNYGAALRAVGRLGDAEAVYRDVVAREPGFAQALGNLAATVAELGRRQEAVGLFERALALDPHAVSALFNLGNTLRELGECPAAIAMYDRALVLAPGDPEIVWNRSLALLLAGQFQEGMAGYEARLDCPMSLAKLAPMVTPMWRGESLVGKTLLLRAEQGFGDAIQFARFSRLVAQRAKAVTLAVPPRLVRLLSESGFPVISEKDVTEGQFDLQAPLMSVPHRLGLSREQMQEGVEDNRYLSTSPERVAAWAQRLGPANGLRIGIHWQGDPNYPHDAERSFPLSTLSPLLGLSGVEWFSLQKGYGAEQLAKLAGAPAVQPIAEDLDLGPDGFLDTAAVVMNLDLVITSDSALPHLCGALGKETWLMLPAVPDWRWELAGTSSYWYSSLRLFRQPASGDWPSVIDRVGVALAERLAQAPR